MSTTTTKTTITEDETVTAPSQPDAQVQTMHEAVRIACALATGELSDPSANALEIRAAARDLNAKGRGLEWHRMVWRHGKWDYFASGRMPRGKFLASERRVTLKGDAFAGEIVCEHNLGAPVDTVYLVTDPHPDGDGDIVKLVKLDWGKQRDGLRIILPTGASLTLPNPRK